MSPRAPAGRVPVGLAAASAFFLAVLAYILASSFARPEMVAYAPSPVEPRSVGDSLITETYTIDARDPEVWVFFDLSAASTVRDPNPRGWDLAVRRHRLVVNGGPRFAGFAGVQEAADMVWEQVREAPPDGYVMTQGSLDSEPTNAALEDWYRYSFLAHTLESRGHTHLIRTAEGRYAKFRILSYYCPGPEAGCLTIQFTYQGDGSRRFFE